MPRGFSGFPSTRSRNDEGDEESYSGDDSEDDDDGFRGAKIRGEAYDQMKAMRKQFKQQKQVKKKIKKAKDSSSSGSDSSSSDEDDSSSSSSSSGSGSSESDSDSSQNETSENESVKGKRVYPKKYEFLGKPREEMTPAQRRWKWVAFDRLPEDMKPYMGGGKQTAKKIKDRTIGPGKEKEIDAEDV